MSNEDDNTDPYDTIHDAARILRSIAYRLNDFAQSFGHTGNVIMLEELSDMSDNISAQADRVHKAVGRQINNEFREAQERSATIVKTALAACLVEREDDEP